MKLYRDKNTRIREHTQVSGTIETAKKSEGLGWKYCLKGRWTLVKNTRVAVKEWKCIREEAHGGDLAMKSDDLQVLDGFVDFRIVRSGGGFR